jgi:hypothetical protein
MLPQDPWTAALSDQTNIDAFLAEIGIGQEPQATFDNLFLHPLPEFPSEAYE